MTLSELPCLLALRCWSSWPAFRIPATSGPFSAPLPPLERPAPPPLLPVSAEPQTLFRRKLCGHPPVLPCIFRSSLACRFRSSLRSLRSRASAPWLRSEEHTSELQSRRDLVCRLLLEKKKAKH